MSPDAITKHRPLAMRPKAYHSARLQSPTPISARLEEIAKPPLSAYQQLYRRYGYVLDPLRAARIRRKLADGNRLTLEQLEEQLAIRSAAAAKRAVRLRREQQRLSLADFGARRLDEMFAITSKQLTTKWTQRLPAKSAGSSTTIVTAATRRLIDYARSVVDKAMEAQLKLGTVEDLVHGCPALAAEERRMRLRVAKELAMMLRRLYFDMAEPTNCAASKAPATDVSKLT